MSLRPEQYLSGRFRAEYRGEQQPDSVRVGGSDYAMEITRGAELTMARPTAAYSVVALTDDQTFVTAVVSAVRVSYADTPVTPARLTTLLNVVVKNVLLKEVVYHSGTVYGVLEGDAYATVGGSEAASQQTFFQELRAPASARGLWRLGCLLPLLTLSVGGCLVSRGLWHGGSTGWLSGGGAPVSEEIVPDLDLDLPDLDSLALNVSDSSNNGVPRRRGQAQREEIPVTGPLSVALSDWSRADGDRVQLLLNNRAKCLVEINRLVFVTYIWG